MPSTRPLVAALHSTWTAAAPTTAALATELPQAQVWNLLDDGLAPDSDTGLRIPERRRVLRLVEHAVRGGVDGVLLTCTRFAGLADTARELWETPIVGPDEALYERLLTDQPARVLALYSDPVAARDGEKRLQAAAAGGTSPAEIRTLVAPAAAEAAREGAPARIAETLAAAVGEPLADGDALILGQYSLAPAEDRLRAALRAPVYSPPRLAAIRLRQLCATSA